MDDVTTELYKAVELVNKRPCQCVPCSFCRGLGNYRVDLRGNPTEACDDLYDLEPCEGGVVEFCDRCREAEDLYRQIEEEGGVVPNG